MQLTMKLLLSASLVDLVAAHKVRAVDGSSYAALRATVDSSNAFANGTVNQDVSHVVATKIAKYRDTETYGSNDCPCIGIDGLEGETWVQLKWPLIGEPYPADLGAHCEAWDNNRHPKCKDEADEGFVKGGPGKGEGWCASRWCYVDPCHCDVGTAPKVASYLPKGRFQGKDLHYSYATCGGVDTFADSDTAASMEAWQAVKSTCANPVDEKKWGVDTCKCIGIDGQPGNTVVTLGEDKVKYPADVGATCKAWDEGLHTECKVDNPPQWCHKKWCYIDACSCDKDVWKAACYLPGASYQGKPMFFSYTACGDKLADQTGVTTNSELDKLCTGGHSGAFAVRPVAALAAILFAMLH